MELLRVVFLVFAVLLLWFLVSSTRSYLQLRDTQSELHQLYKAKSPTLLRISLATKPFTLLLIFLLMFNCILIGIGVLGAKP